jgi:hypothetical protein
LHPHTPKAVHGYVHVHVNDHVGIGSFVNVDVDVDVLVLVDGFSKSPPKGEMRLTPENVTLFPAQSPLPRVIQPDKINSPF